MATDFYPNLLIISAKNCTTENVRVYKSRNSCSFISENNEVTAFWKDGGKRPFKITLW